MIITKPSFILFKCTNFGRTVIHQELKLERLSGRRSYITKFKFRESLRYKIFVVYFSRTVTNEQLMGLVEEILI